MVNAAENADRTGCYAAASLLEQIFRAGSQSEFLVYLLVEFAPLVLQLASTSRHSRIGTLRNIKRTITRFGRRFTAVWNNVSQDRFVIAFKGSYLAARLESRKSKEVRLPATQR